MTWQVFVLAGGAVVAGSAILVWKLGRSADRRRGARFADRRRLTVDELWREYYPGGEIPLSVVDSALNMIGAATGVAPGVLRPTDRFNDQLAPEKGWEFDDGLAELRWALESYERGASAGILTIDDFIRRLAGESRGPSREGAT